MAKWGEGDPRWIVEERADATNVNNWHWTEKDASTWSKEKLKTLLLGLNIEGDKGSCNIKEVISIDGEAIANNRKAKLIFFYEWLIKLKWEGTIEDNDKILTGEVEIPNLSEEHSPEDVDIIFTAKDNNDESYVLKELMRSKGTPLIREMLAKYIGDLKLEFSKGMILPSKKDSPSQNNSLKDKENVAKKVINQPIESKNCGTKISSKGLTSKIDFQCPPSLLYRALTETEMVQAFTQGGVDEYNCKKGGQFSLYGKTICGEFVELVHEQTIKMRWRLKDWPKAHYSDVTFQLVDQNGSTQLNLTQTGIPSSDYDRTKDGWKRYYWDRIRQTFGFGATLF